MNIDPAKPLTAARIPVVSQTEIACVEHSAGRDSRSGLADKTPASVKTLILAHQRQILAFRQENQELRVQLTTLATELAQLRVRTDETLATPPNRPRPKVQGSSRLSVAKAVAASVAASRVTPVPGASESAAGGWRSAAGQWPPSASLEQNSAHLPPVAPDGGWPVDRPGVERVKPSSQRR